MVYMSNVDGLNLPGPGILKFKIAYLWICNFPRSLVAKLCFVREDVDQAANELGLVFPGSEYMEFMETTWRLLPEGNAAFVSNLMQTGNPDKRYYLLLL